MDQIEVAGLRVAYERAGEGPALVLLNGYVGDGSAARPHVAGLSFGGGPALELYRRHPTIPASLMLAGAYTGWAGSLPPEVVDQRLQQALRLVELPPDELARALVPTMFSESAPAEMIDGFRATLAGFHPTGLRVMARSFAEADLRDVLPHIDVSTVLLHGERDVLARSTSPKPSTPRFRDRGSWSCPASVT